MPKLIAIEGDDCIQIGDAKQEVVELSEQWSVGFMSNETLFGIFAPPLPAGRRFRYVQGIGRALWQSFQPAAPRQYSQAAREADRKRWAEDDKGDDEAGWGNSRCRVRRALAGEGYVDMPDPAMPRRRR
jgi:hypothetical protein